ncbi:fibronectin type III domain-containing protein [Paenibacillus macerans]|nr:fibronectin type III domain-containing protein [Paenibacillus macerans]
MKRIGHFILVLAIFLSVVFVGFTGVSAASQYTGGLLDSVPVQVGTAIGQSSTAVAQMTDGNISTYTDLSSGKFAWHTFSAPVEISAVVAKYTGTVAVEFYDANNNLLQKYALLNNDGVQTLPSPVKGVSTIALKYTAGTYATIYEWNVFTAPSAAPLPTTINWIRSGDQIVKLEWAATGAESYNVKRATSPGGPYILLTNVKGTSYSDTAVTNGTTYYYVVSAVNRGGESANSPEKGIKPDATKYTGGLLDWLTLKVGTSISSPASTTRNLTDNNTSTYTDISSGNFVWHTFSAPVEISAVVAKYTGTVAVEFYDANNNLLQKYALLNNDGVQTLPSPVKGVSTIALKYTAGTYATIYEWNVFTAPSAAPLPTTINWIRSGDQIVKLEWAATGAESYNVKRATSPGGPYILLTNVKGTSYSDTAVTNGTTYYYVVSAVNRAGESANSPEKGIKPEATKYTGGLLDWLALKVGTSVSSPTSTTRNLTDNNTSTYTDISSGNFVWYTFSSPVEISAVIAKYTGTVAVEFYDANNNLLHKYDLLNNDGVQTLPSPVQGVSIIALKYTKGTYATIYEWNVFGKGGETPSPQEPLSLTATAGNKKVNLTWSGAGKDVTSFNVKRATVSGGPYDVIDTVTSDTYNYTDSNVTNGTTYYYIVTAVTAAGESGNSNEASATPKGDVVNPPDPGQEGERALLRLILINGIEKEYDLSMTEVNAFINWYEERANGSGTAMFAIDKHDNNKGPFVNRKDYVFFDKIITFEVNAY